MKFLTTLLTLLLSLKSWSLPPEGMEGYAIHNKDQNSLFTSATYQNPNFHHTSFEYNVYGTFLTESKNAFTMGGLTELSSELQRDSFFLRYDQVFWDITSISLKWIHQDWRYIDSAKESVGGELNFYIPFGEHGLYMAFGTVYRWLKQSWNDSPSSPFNFNTKDTKGYYSIILGSKISFNGNHYLTVDLNSRSHYSYYYITNIAFDVSYNLSFSSFHLRLWNSWRTTGMLMGVGNITNWEIGLGFLVL